MKIELGKKATARDANTIDLKHDGDNVTISVGDKEAALIERVDHRHSKTGEYEAAGYPKTKYYLIWNGLKDAATAKADVATAVPGTAAYSYADAGVFVNIRCQEEATWDDNITVRVLGVSYFNGQAIVPVSPNIPPPDVGDDEDTDPYITAILNGVGWAFGVLAVIMAGYVCYRVWRHIRHGDELFPRLTTLMQKVG
jgi:hypothetical protein